VVARLSLIGSIHKPVPLGPFEDAVLPLEVFFSFFIILLSAIVVETLGHAIFEALAAEWWLFKDPIARLAIRVLEQLITTLCTPLEAIVDEAFVACADRGLTPLLARSMAIAVLVSALIDTALNWLAVTCDWMLGMAFFTLAAGFAYEGRPALADTGFLIAARCPFPVAEALRCAKL
jgi:hypothetical protein